VNPPAGRGVFIALQAWKLFFKAIPILNVWKIRKFCDPSPTLLSCWKENEFLPSNMADAEQTNMQPQDEFEKTNNILGVLR
jgi:hypothetical protein